MGLSNPSFPPSLADTDRVRTDSRELVPRPFEAGHYISGDSSGASINMNASIGSKDGSGTALIVNVPAGTNGARIQVPFFGRVFGVTFRRSIGAGNQIPAEFSVRLDGVAFAIQTGITKVNLYSQTIEDSLCKVIVSSDLADGEHLAEITVVAPSSGTDQIYLESYLVEKRAGYIPVEKTDVLLTPAAGAFVPTVAGLIYDTMSGSFATGTFGIGRKVSKVRWQNNTGSAVTDLVVTMNSIIYASPSSIANKDSFELTFSPPLAMNSVWKHVSSAGGVNFPYFVFGSYN